MPSLPRRVLRRGRAAATLARQGPRPMVARRLARAGLVDRDWYAAQSGRRWDSDSAAAGHYLRTGRRAGWSLHPVLEPEWIVGPAWRTSRLDPAQLYLAGRSQRGGPGPAFDDATYLAVDGGSAHDLGGPLGHFLRHRPGAPLPVPQGRPAVTVSSLRSWLDTPLPAAVPVVDWAGQLTGLPQRTAGLTTLVLAVDDQWSAALALVDSVLGQARSRPAEVVLVARQPRAAVRRILLGAYGGDPRVRWLAWGNELSLAQAWNAGLAAGSGDVAILARARCTVRPGAAGRAGQEHARSWWEVLREALDDPAVAAVAPLLLGPTGTVASAGLGVRSPTHALVLASAPAPAPAEHAGGATFYRLFADEAADELVAAGALPVPALGDEVLAARVADLVAAEGVDLAFSDGLWGADLSRRLARRAAGASRGPGLLVLPSARLVLTGDDPVPAGPTAADASLLGQRWAADPAGPQRPAGPQWDEDATWARTGLAVSGVRPDPTGVLASPILVRARAGAGGAAGARPALRWAIKIAAPSSEQGDRWGDVHFAADLAAALRRLGQHVGVDRRPAHERSTAGLDDVVLNLRGLATPHLHPEQVNVVWVISHPDQVSAEELRRYDLRFAASTSWSATMTARSGVAVEALLQATDPARFHPGLAEPGSGPAVLFVGNSRGVLRPIVRDAVAAGADLAVYGTRWSDFIDPAFVRGPYLPNETVGAAYRGAGVVLNDHWPDMAAQGFVSNRVFDVVASGGRVISDPVEGLAELFGGAVVQYRTPADLARWTGPDRDLVFADPAELLEISARVRAEHSFDARAGRLLAAVGAVLADRGAAPTPTASR